MMGLLLRKVLAVAKCVGNAGTGAVVATREAWRRLIVAVAVEREIPSDLAPKFDVVGDVDIGMHAARVGDGWQYIRSDVEIGFVEVEELHLPDDQCDRLCPS